MHSNAVHMSCGMCSYAFLLHPLMYRLAELAALHRAISLASMLFAGAASGVLIQERGGIASPAGSGVLAALPALVG